MQHSTQKQRPYPCHCFQIFEALEICGLLATITPVKGHVGQVFTQEMGPLIWTFFCCLSLCICRAPDQNQSSQDPEKRLDVGRWRCEQPHPCCTTVCLCACLHLGTTLWSSSLALLSTGERGPAGWTDSCLCSVSLNEITSNITSEPLLYPVLLFLPGALCCWIPTFVRSR